VNQICLENDVKFIFVMYPTMNNEMHSIANGVIEICKENNIEFIDFYKLTEEIELNENEDMTDGFHFNISGAKKVTSYLGNYLIERGYVTDRRNDPEFVSWHEDYENSEYKKLYADS